MNSCRQGPFNRCYFLSLLAVGFLASSAHAYAEQNALWILDSVREVAALEQPGTTWTVAISQDGRSMAAGGWNKGDHKPPGWITVWDTSTWKLTRTFRIDDSRIQRLCFLPGHRTLVVAGFEETHLFAVDLESGALHDIERTLDTNGIPMSFATEREGRFLLTSCESEGVKLWKTSPWRLNQYVAGSRGHYLYLAANPADWTPFLSWGYLRGRSVRASFPVSLDGYAPAAFRRNWLFSAPWVFP